MGNVLVQELVEEEEEITKCPFVDLYENYILKYRNVKLVYESTTFWIIEVSGQRPDTPDREARIIKRDKEWTIHRAG